MRRMLLKVGLVLVFMVNVFGQISTASPWQISPLVEKENKSGISLTPILLEHPVDSTYVLGSGDVLEILVEKSNFPVQVGPEGSIALEEVGIIPVAGLPLYVARDTILNRIERRYSKRWNHVNLIQLRQTSVFFTGAVGIPGNHVNRGQARLSLFIRQAGGVTHSGNDQEILLIRGADTTKVNHAAFENGGFLDQDPVLYSGDHIHVPFLDQKKPTVRIHFLNHTQTAIWKENLTFYDYLFSTGLIRSSNAMRFVRIENASGTTKMLGLREALTKVLQAGDWVEVISEKNQVFVGGATSRNGAFDFVPGLKAKDYISMAGLTVLSGNIDDVVVLRLGQGYININAFEDEIFPGDVLLLPKNTFESIKELVAFLGSVMGIIATSLSLYLLIQQNR